jgi:biopolymer transport protein ExbD
VNAELNVVPMVDMMTMLVIFLLQQFSATGEVLFMQKDIKLPEAQHGQTIEVAPVIAISSDLVVLDGQKIADVRELEADSALLNINALEEKLRDSKKRWDFIHQNEPDREKSWKGDVNVQADVKVPFRILKRVMFSAAQAGYYNLNFATLEAPGSAPGAPAAPPAAPAR